MLGVGLKVMGFGIYYGVQGHETWGRQDQSGREKWEIPSLLWKIKIRFFAQVV